MNKKKNPRYIENGRLLPICSCLLVESKSFIFKILLKNIRIFQRSGDIATSTKKKSLEFYKRRVISPFHVFIENYYLIWNHKTIIFIYQILNRISHIEFHVFLSYFTRLVSVRWGGNFNKPQKLMGNTKIYVFCLIRSQIFRKNIPGYNMLH